MEAKNWDNSMRLCGGSTPIWQTFLDHNGDDFSSKSIANGTGRKERENYNGYRTLRERNDPSETCLHVPDTFTCEYKFMRV